MFNWVSMHTILNSQGSLQDEILGFYLFCSKKGCISESQELG